MLASLLASLNMMNNMVYSLYNIEPSQLKKLNENSTDGIPDNDQPLLEFLISYGLYRVIVLLWMLMGLRRSYLYYES